MTKLTPEEISRYARHLAIPNFGVPAQEKLKAARVLVVGAGGLGSPLLLYLAAAGVGTIGIVDDDRVDLTNLQRQVLYSTQDIGQFKVELAYQKIKDINPHIQVNLYPERLTRNNAERIIKDYDVVADGTDNFPTRYLVNDACVLLNKINVYASIFRFEGQVSVFNYLNENGERGPNYRDLFPEPPPPGLVPDCATGGVLGVLPGIIGSMQASEVIKVITGIGEPLAGRLFLFDAADFTSRILKIKKHSSIIISELIDYEIFCGINEEPSSDYAELDSTALFELQNSSLAVFHLIDVREPPEYAIDHLTESQLIPLSDLVNQLDKIPENGKIIIYCQSGQRSKKAILQILKHKKIDQLFNLTGGLTTFRKAYPKA